MPLGAALHRALRAAAHLAVWAGAYVASAVVCFTQTAGLEAVPNARTLTFAFCTAAGVYLLDRVKARDAWLDPADEAAHPNRYHFLAAHAAPVRTLMVFLLCAATVLGSTLRHDLPWLGTLTPSAAALAVLVYAARPRRTRPRPKDVLLVKNLYVAAGITGFAAATAIATTTPAPLRISELRSHAAWIIAAAIHLLVRVAADAVLCDLDDHAADLAYGTRTLPGTLGHARAWNTALAARLVIAAALAALALIHSAPREPLLVWSVVTALSSLALRLAAPTRVRDWVDARFLIEAAVATMVLWVLHARV